MHVIGSLAELVEIVVALPGTFVRYSKGPDADWDTVSVDYEARLRLPGLSVSALEPEPWWDRPVEDWVARRLCSYLHLKERARDERVAWVLRGELVGRGPDSEPLVRPGEVLGLLSDAVLEEALRHYHLAFDAGRSSL